MNVKPVEETVSFSVSYYEDVGFSFHLKEPGRKGIPEQSALCILSDKEALRLAEYIIENTRKEPKTETP